MGKIKYAIDQFRLLIAEYLIRAAVEVAPKDHPDTVAILEASVLVFSRKPS